MTTTTLTLAAFLTAMLDEDEAVARVTRSQSVAAWESVFSNEPARSLNQPFAAHIARHDPARVLADVEAKRAIVAIHVPDRQLENWYWPERKCAECGQGWHAHLSLSDHLPTEIGPEQGCRTLRLLAQPYRDHPDWREEWSA